MFNSKPQTNYRSVISHGLILRSLIVVSSKIENLFCFFVSFDHFNLTIYFISLPLMRIINSDNFFVVNIFNSGGTHKPIRLTWRIVYNIWRQVTKLATRIDKVKSKGLGIKHTIRLLLDVENRPFLLFLD